MVADSFPEIQFIDGGSVWLDLVASPSRYDRAMMERTATIAERGLTAAITGCEPGVPERVVCLEALDEMATLGSEFILSRSISTHVNVGSFSIGNSNLRPFLFTGAELQSGQMFWIDVIACYRGYYFDCNRTVSIGEPTTEQRELYEVTREMYDSMRKAVRGGLSGGELWAIGHRVADEAGYGDCINAAFLGHGTGVSLVDRPVINQDESNPIRSGTYLNLEPGIFVPGVGSACLENTLYVSEDGPVQLNQSSNELFVV